MTSQFLADKTLAARYEVSRSTIWRWVREGRLPKPLKINGSTRWSSEQLSKWEQKEVAGI